jgi:hypothetical protein
MKILHKAAQEYSQIPWFRRTIYKRLKLLISLAISYLNLDNKIFPLPILGSLNFENIPYHGLWAVVIPILLTIPYTFWIVVFPNSKVETLSWGST